MATEGFVTCPGNLNAKMDVVLENASLMVFVSAPYQLVFTVCALSDSKKF